MGDQQRGEVGRAKLLQRGEGQLGDAREGAFAEGADGLVASGCRDVEVLAGIGKDHGGRARAAANPSPLAALGTGIQPRWAS